MTDTRATQIPVEQWLSTDPDARLTQISVEQWASAANVPPYVVLSQISIEQWATVAEAGGTQTVRVMVLA